MRFELMNMGFAIPRINHFATGAVADQTRFELATSGFGIQRSTNWSYWPFCYGVIKLFTGASGKNRTSDLFVPSEATYHLPTLTYGAGLRLRTAGLLITNQALYQLS